MRKIIVLAAIFLLLVSAGAWSHYTLAANGGWCENGFDLYLTNDTKSVQYYWFYWVDHPYQQTHYGPMNLAGGELQPSKTLDLANKYCPGVYFVMWQTAYSDEEEIILPFEVTDGCSLVTITCDEVRKGVKT